MMKKGEEGIMMMRKGEEEIMNEGKDDEGKNEREERMLKEEGTGRMENKAHR